MGVRHMTGTPWHLETLKSNDSRRHKSNCGYYDNGHCQFYIEPCRGSAHCDKYDENVQCYRAKTKQYGPKWRVHKNNKSIPPLSDAYSIGDHIVSIYFVDGQAKYKSGIILDIDSHNYVIAEFTRNDGSTYTYTFHYPEMLRYVKHPMK